MSNKTPNDWNLWLRDLVAWGKKTGRAVEFSVPEISLLDKAEFEALLESDDE